jgi:hypothetical protein
MTRHEAFALPHVLTAAFASFRPFNPKLGHLGYPQRAVDRVDMNFQIGDASANLWACWPEMGLPG